MGLKLIGEVALDGSGFQRGLSQISDAAGGLAGHIAEIFSVAAIEEFIRRSLESAKQIKSFAGQMGITTEEVQRFQIAAKESNLEFENIAAGLVKLGKARKAAAESNDSLLKTFERFGVSMEDLQNPGLRNVDILEQISAAIEHMDLTAADRTALDELLGRMGEKLNIVLKKAKEVSEIQIIGDAQLETLAKAEKTVDRMTRSLTTLGTVGLAHFFDRFQSMYDYVADVRDNMRRGMSYEDASAKAIGKQKSEIAATQEEEDWQEFLSTLGSRVSGDLFENKRHTPRSARERQLGSDSLSAVGNFLGQGSGLINSIAQDQLDTSRKALDEHKLTNQKLDELNNRISAFEELDIP